MQIISRYLPGFDESIERVETWATARDSERVYPDYLVSSFGRVRNIIKGRVLQTKKTARGYRQVHMQSGNERTNRHVHVIVANTFLARPDGADHVDHAGGTELADSDHVRNLRWTTVQENSINRTRLNRNNTSGYIGVTRYRQERWRAHFMACGRCKTIGYYNDKVDAAIARDAFAGATPWSDYVRRNFPADAPELQTPTAVAIINDASARGDAWGRQVKAEADANRAAKLAEASAPADSAVAEDAADVAENDG